MEVRVEFSAGRAGNATAPPEKVTTPSIEAVGFVPTLEADAATVVMAVVEGMAADEDEKLQLLTLVNPQLDEEAVIDSLLEDLLESRCALITLAILPEVVRVTTPPFVCNWFDDIATTFAGIATCCTTPPGR